MLAVGIASLLFTAELQRRVTDAGSDVIATAAHPGYANTNLGSHYRNRAVDILVAISNRLFAQNAHAGALPAVYAATAELPGNSFVGPDGFQGSAASRSSSDAPPPPRTWILPARCGTSQSS